MPGNFAIFHEISYPSLSNPKPNLNPKPHWTIGQWPLVGAWGDVYTDTIVCNESYMHLAAGSSLYLCFDKDSIRVVHGALARSEKQLCLFD
jgi:hypothetical protein